MPVMGADMLPPRRFRISERVEACVRQPACSSVHPIGCGAGIGGLVGEFGTRPRGNVNSGGQCAVRKENGMPFDAFPTSM